MEFDWHNRPAYPFWRPAKNLDICVSKEKNSFHDQDWKLVYNAE